MRTTSPCWCAISAGYRNLIKLVSRAYLEGFYYKPRVDKALLAEHAEGLLVLSGCLNSEVSRLISAGEVGRAHEAAGWYQEVFGKDYYFMEVQAHGLPEQARVTAETLRIARALGAPIAGTNDSHYLEATHARAHEALLCIQTGSTLNDPGHWRFSTQEFYVKSAAEMAQVFAETPEACRNTLAVAERCNLTLEFNRFHLPRYVVPDGHTLESYLQETTRAGLRERYGPRPVTRSRPGWPTSWLSSRRWALPAISSWSGTSSALPASTASPWARAGVPPPDPSWPTALALPTSIQFVTGSSSSDF